MLDRERIRAAAVRLLDAEGPARFSMRRLAAGLGVTAMSLYWYVDTKHDLLELALDNALGELGEQQEPAGPPVEGWPGRLRSPARGYRRLLVDHPWVAPLTAAYPNIGPQARRPPGYSAGAAVGSWAAGFDLRATSLMNTTSTSASSAVGAA